MEKFYRFVKSQGLAVSRDTLHQFIVYLEDCFLIRVIWLEGTSERRRMVNPRKIYPIDPGLIPVFDRSGKTNWRHALETAVLIELERRGKHVYYLRTKDGFEVDFLAVSPDGRKDLIQVCYDLTDTEAKEREIRALFSASEEYPQSSLNIITPLPETVGKIPGKIKVYDASIWLLKFFE